MLKVFSFNLFIFILVTFVSCRLFYSNFYFVVLFFILSVYFILLFYFAFLRVGLKAHLGPKSKLFIRPQCRPTAIRHSHARFSPRFLQPPAHFSLLIVLEHMPQLLESMAWKDMQDFCVKFTMLQTGPAFHALALLEPHATAFLDVSNLQRPTVAVPVPTPIQTTPRRS